MIEIKKPSPRPKHFVVDARTLLTLGRDSIKDHLTAIIELVKNSYDADATLVEVHIESGTPSDSYIRIADNGTGMTEEDIDDRWLRIGYSAKQGATLTQLSRRRTGEKGIGRISADRLGSRLLLRTKTQSTPPVALSVDWDRFNKSGNTLQTVEIDFYPESEIELPIGHSGASKSGTELIIRNLRQNWPKAEVEALREELSTLTPPFGGVKDFSITLTTNLSHAFSGIVQSPFWERAELRLELELADDLITYSVSGQLLPSPKRDSLQWGQLIQRIVNNRAYSLSHLVAVLLELRFCFFLVSQIFSEVQA